MNILHNHDLRRLNTFGIASRAEMFVTYDSVRELQAFLAARDKNEPLFHMGGGSNLILPDRVPGYLLHSQILGIAQAADEGDAVLVRAGAGETFDHLIAWCIARGLSGLENLSFIPGEVGASAVQNIGAYGVEAADSIAKVEAVDLATGAERTFAPGELAYGYRTSRFKTDWAGRFAVTAVTFRLSRTFRPNLSYAGLAQAAEGVKALDAAQLRNLIKGLRDAKLPDPERQGSVGSFFKNPVVSTADFERLRAEHPQIGGHVLPAGNIKLSAGWLIEQCGWKGRGLAGVGVYEKQALVFVNLGGATGAQVRALCEAVQRDVQTRFGVQLEPEANLLL